MHFSADGYEISKLGDEGSVIGRANAHNVDLNRNFPDQYGINEYNKDQEPETLAVMNWSLSNSFILSANLHGGALVANYPLDDSPKDFQQDGDRRTVKNPTEENEVFKHLASVYATSHRKMYQGKPCPSFIRETFPEGITNGAAWYAVTGGMQDWSYLQGGTYEITLEVGCYKFPKAEELSGYWLDNKEALIKYIEEVHKGVKGFVKSSIGTPIKHAAISINNIQHVTYTAKDGDYYRLLLPGIYNITASAKGYEAVTTEIVVPDSGSLIHNFHMMRDDPQHWSSAYDFRILPNILNTRYHSNDEIGQAFVELSRVNWWMAQLEEDGNSEIYHSLKVTAGIGQAEETKIHVLILSSLFETSPVGREMTLNLARHVITAYNTKEPNMLELMNNTVLHFVTVNENFDNVYEQFQRNNTICDPRLKEELGDRLLSAESDPIKDAFFKLFEKDEVSMALTFTAGDDTNVQVLKDREPVYAEIENKFRSHFGAQNQLCPSNAHRINENESLDKATNFMYSMFKLPFYTVNLGCCKMPRESEIADIYKEKLTQFLSFINMARTGVKGFVQDQNKNPLRKAKIVIDGTSRVHEVSKNLAFFHVLVPSGPTKLIITCEGFKAQTIAVQAGVNMVDLKEITLEIDTVKTAEQLFSISGFVTDDDGSPLENAEIGIKDIWNKKAYTNHVGQFEMKDINKSSAILTVKAQGFVNSEKLVMMNQPGSKNIIFKLAASDEDMGFRNLIFVFAVCTAILFLVVFCTFMAINGCSASCPCVGWCSTENRRHLADNYKFSLLTKKSSKKPSLFEDDVYGDDEEEELFSPTTLKREFLMDLQSFSESKPNFFATFFDSRQLSLETFTKYRVLKKSSAPSGLISGENCRMSF